jgi:hypothetical protein
VCDLNPDARPLRPTILASASARSLEASLAATPGLACAARGHVCFVVPDAPAGGGDLGPRHMQALLAGVLPGDAVAILHMPPAALAAELEGGGQALAGALLRVELPRDRSLAALAVRELHGRGLRVRIASRPLGRVAARRALAGIEPGGSTSRRSRQLLRGVTGAGLIARAREATGQALPAVLGAAAVLLLGAFGLAAVGGAVTGKGRAQRVADLAAVSAARSLRDDLPRAMAPARLPSGARNPAHLSRGAYLARARGAALEAASRNGAARSRMDVRFPGGGPLPPLRARVGLRAAIELGRDGSGIARGSGATRRLAVIATATAEASPPVSWTGMERTGVAEGGGYSGPLAYRQGKPMRPDVAGAFDRMAAAARRAGIGLVVTSAFRSNAEQARLFAAHPDPRWVAPPGRSLHRCATELDLGPSAAYGWLAGNAGHFGFLKRYAWEPWHFGYTRGPPPCSSGALTSTTMAGSAARARSADGRGARAGGLPSFVPPRFRSAVLRSAARWNVSAGLLAAQLLAESNFNPSAVSPAGARGIAQFMPGTARSYGLRNPFDAPAAIDAQAHLMADLLNRFRSVPLALAAYNAGPGAVGACHCVPPYAETRAYVARILSLLRGSGDLDVPLEVRLVV